MLVDRYIQVLFNLPIDKTFTYLCPDSYLETQGIASSTSLHGYMVLAPFRGKRKLGIIVEAAESTSDGKEWSHRQKEKQIDYAILAIESLIPLPPLHMHTWHIAKWIQKRYATSLGMAWHLFVPYTPAMIGKKKRKNESEQPPLEADLASAFNPLENPLKSETFSSQREYSSITLSAEQEHIVQEWIKLSQHQESHPEECVGLLFGVTGSGKTHLYIAWIQYVLSQKKQVLFLVPEILFSTQLMTRLHSYFPPDSIAMIHSRLTPKERFLTYQKIYKKEVSIVVGPRSALFAPFSSLGMIIMDEEQDMSYKSQQNPRYHARAIAFALAKQWNIPFMMGSATPSIETFHLAYQEKKIHLFVLESRFQDISFPTIDYVPIPEHSTLSEKMMQKLFFYYKQKKQSVLFLNRRGFAPRVYCNACHHIFQCPQCDIYLVYHKMENMLRCHHCNYFVSFEGKCIHCEQETKLSFYGEGTEKIEHQIQTLMKQMNILRMDKDSMTHRQDYSLALERFVQDKMDLLVGTQMIAKGLDFDDLLFTGVLDADASLYSQDFRSHEKTFSLITQVAGRAGRKESGEVLVQTNHPEHFVFQCIQNHAYVSFYEQEIVLRQKYQYPPFSALVRVLFSLSDPKKSKYLSMQWEKQIKNSPILKGIDITAFQPCPIERIEGKNRYHILFKIPLAKRQKVIQEIYRISKIIDPRAIFTALDPDPYHML